MAKIPYEESILFNQLEDTSKKVNEIVTAGKNIFNINDPDCVLGYYVNSVTGAINENSSYNSTGFIPVISGEIYTISQKLHIAWYDSSKAFISGSSASDESEQQMAPANAVYLRCSVFTASWNLFQVEIGGVKTAFEAYKLSLGTIVNLLNSSVGTEKIANSAITSEKIINSSIGPEKTSFIYLKVGKNKFNINASDISIGHYVVSTNGTLGESASYNATGYIPVIAGQVYTLSIKYHIAWYNSAKVFISGSSTNDESAQQTAPVGAAYLRCSLSTAYWSIFQVEEGSSQTLWEAYSTQEVFTGAKIESSDVIGLPSGIVPVARVGKNKFNVDASDISIGYYLAYTNGTLAENASYNSTGFIPVIAGQAYTLSYKHVIAWYNSAKSFISSSNSSDTNPVQTAPAGAVYLRCTVHVSIWSIFQVEIGTVQTLWEAYIAYNTFSDIKYESADVLGLPALVDAGILSQLSFLKTNRIAMPAKQYFLSTYENTIYHQAICERWLPDMYFVQLENGTFVNRKSFARITNPVADASVDARLYNLDFNVISAKNFEVLVGNQATNNGALVISAIGDSLTYNSSYLLRARQLCPALTFTGTRIPYGDSAITCEGRGGWTLAMYFSELHSTIDSFSPFLHLADPYKYYGNTDFWKKVVTGDTSYGYNGFAAKATAIGFSSSTGLKSAPAANDVMYNDTNARYERYDGAAWVAFAAVAGDFTFNYGKYRSVWNIAQPNIVTVMLGTNDFRDLAVSAIPGVFEEWKTRFETMVTSIHADSPLAKIALLIPPSVVGGGNDSIDFTSFNVKQNASMWNARKLMIDNFDEMETSDKIYLVDTGSSLDPIYGIELLSSEKPFSDYDGTETVKLQNNSPHPFTTGYFQMGIRLAGFIQTVR